MPPSVEIWFVVVSNNTDGMGPCFAIWMYSAANLRKKFYVICTGTNRSERLSLSLRRVGWDADVNLQGFINHAAGLSRNQGRLRCKVSTTTHGAPGKGSASSRRYAGSLNT